MSAAGNKTQIRKKEGDKWVGNDVVGLNKTQIRKEGK